MVIDAVSRLVEAHRAAQPAVEFKPSTWLPRLFRWPAVVEALLDDRLTAPSENGRRTVDRSGLRAAVRDIDCSDENTVLRAFGLIVVWGSGVRTRSYRNLPRALSAPECGQQLNEAARLCREGEFAKAYQGWQLPGIGPAYFTKWFAFAGDSPSVRPRPLILDRRVWRTLTGTLGLTKADLGGRSPAQRYVSYLVLLDGWARELRVDAEQIEYALFAHNGRPLEAVGVPPSPPAG